MLCIMFRLIYGGCSKINSGLRHCPGCNPLTLCIVMVNMEFSGTFWVGLSKDNGQRLGVCNPDLSIQTIYEDIRSGGKTNLPFPIGLKIVANLRYVKRRSQQCLETKKSNVLFVQILCIAYHMVIQLPRFI